MFTNTHRKFPMGILNMFSKSKGPVPTALGYSPTTGFLGAPIGVPYYSPSQLATLIFPDADTSLVPVDEATALTVPPVIRTVGIYTALSQGLPLIGADWLEVSTPPYSPELRKARIIQDLFFYNASVVTVTRDADGYVTDYAHLLRGLWSIDSEGNILVRGVKVDQSSVVWIPGYMPQGFLEYARDSIRQYRNITNTINKRTSTPSPNLLIKETMASDVFGDEIDEDIERIRETLASENGGISYIPYGLELESFGATAEDNAYMIQAREAIRKDVANFAGIQSSMLDGNSGDTTMTYQNALDQKNELVELSLKLFTEPLAARLSMDDVTPPGVKVEFDYSVYNTPTAQGNGPADTPALGGPNV